MPPCRQIFYHSTDETSNYSRRSYPEKLRPLDSAYSPSVIVAPSLLILALFVDSIDEIVDLGFETGQAFM